MKKNTLTLLCAILFSLQAVAATPRLEIPITYHPDAGVVDKVKSECMIEGMLADQVSAQMRRVFRSDDVLLEKDGDPAGRPVLRLQITHVLGVGGGAWTGPKAITVAAELIGEDGQVRRTKINRWSVGGVWGGFRGTCSILQRCSVAIGKDLARWSKDPAYRITEIPMPPEGQTTPDAKPGEVGPTPNDDASTEAPTLTLPSSSASAAAPVSDTGTAGNKAEK